MINVGLKLNQAKAGFFDRLAVVSALDAATHRMLSRFGAFVRQRAKMSIRARGGASKPGSPPNSHTGLLKKFILFSYDQSSRSVVIGPTLLNGKESKDANVALEYGGRFLRRSRNKRYMATYEARPFMRPAFDEEVKKLPDIWAHAINR